MILALVEVAGHGFSAIEIGVGVLSIVGIYFLGMQLLHLSQVALKLAMLLALRHAVLTAIAGLGLLGEVGLLEEGLRMVGIDVEIPSLGILDGLLDML